MGLFGEQVPPRMVNVACGIKVTEPFDIGSATSSTG
jgi:hypothetical protein